MICQDKVGIQQYSSRSHVTAQGKKQKTQREYVLKHMFESCCSKMRAALV